MRALQPLLAVELLVANDGWVAGPVKAVSRRRRGPRPPLGPAIQPYSATEVDGWQHADSAGCLKTGPQYTQGKLSDAQAEVKKALDVDRNHALARSVQDAILADIKQMEQPQAAQTDTDYSTCTNGQIGFVQRGEACDRVIRSGTRSRRELSAAFAGRGWWRENTNDPTSAAADYTEAIRLDPANTMAINNRGAILLNKNQLADALRDFDDALRVAPTFVWALANKAEVLRRQGKLSEAQEEIKKALNIDSNHARAREVEQAILADLKWRGSDRQRPSTDQTIPQQSTRSDPEADALRKRASGHFQNKDYDSAIADWTDVIRKGGAIWLDYNERGRAYYGKGQNAQALADFNQAISLAGHGPEPHFNRALVHERNRDYGEARDDLDAAINRHGPVAAEYYINLARMYSNMSNYSQAILTYDKLIEMYDKDKSVERGDKAFAFYLRGLAKRNQVLAERARCPTRIPPDPGCMDPMRFAVAVLDLEQALIYAPNNAYANFEKGWIAAEIGNTPVAIEAYSAAIKADSTYSMAYNNRGVQYSKLKQNELAFSDYNDAIRYDANNKFAWANRGALFAITRQRRRAIEDLRKALSIDPNYAFAQSVLRSLGVRP